MLKNEIIQKLSNIIINELGLGENMSDINSDTTLVEAGIDSIAAMSLLVYVEELFNIQADDDVLLGNMFNCIGDIADYILSKTA